MPTDQSDASLIAYFDDYGRRVAKQCLDQDPDFVLSISANNFARDIEMFRRALGERRLSFGMISNSGPVAAVYASLFPKRVRAMLIDSTVPLLPRPRRLPRCGRIPGIRKVSENPERSPLGNGGRPW